MFVLVFHGWTKTNTVLAPFRDLIFNKDGINCIALSLTGLGEIHGCISRMSKIIFHLYPYLLGVNIQKAIKLILFIATKLHLSQK